jgi:magnesium-transporting ATPase (P-type)
MYFTSLTDSDISRLQAVCQYEKPNIRLYEFNGKLIVKDKAYPIVNENILLRGCTLRVSPLVYGLAIYTGKDTKMMMNTNFKSNKLSVIERRLNQFILVFLAILAVFTFVSFGLHFTSLNFYTQHWYLTGREPMYFNVSRRGFGVDIYTRDPTISFEVSFGFESGFRSIRIKQSKKPKETKST